MRILILSQHFPPEPIVRLRDLTQYLAGQGHEVSVLTTFPSYPLGRVYDGYALALTAEQQELGVPVHRVFAVPYRGTVKSKRMVSYFSFALASLLLGLLPRRRPDVIYVYHPPLTTGLSAALFNLMSGVPFVYDVQDLWPDAIVAAGMLREGGSTYRGLRWMENLVYRQARHVNVLSGGMKSNLLGKGVPEQKISVISNWGDPDTYQPADSSDLRRSLGWGERFVAMVAGNLGLTHGLETVITAAERLQANPDVLFVFVGSGAAKPALVADAAARGLQNVKFYDQVPPAEAARYINAADVMLVHLKPTLEGEFSLPHRIFSYMLCGKPILAAATGGTAEIIQANGCGWICPPSNPAALSALVAQAAADPAARRRLGQNGLATAHGPYSRQHLLAQIEQTIVEAAQGWGRAVATTPGIAGAVSPSDNDTVEVFYGSNGIVANVQKRPDSAKWPGSL